MKAERTVKTVVTRTHTVQLSEKDIKQALLDQYDMQGGEVHFNESSCGGLNGATLILTSQEEWNDNG